MKIIKILTFILLTTFTASAQTVTPIRVNCGGPAYTDSTGNVWQADNGFTGGSAYVQSGIPVRGTADSTLFDSIRQANQGGSFTYNFTVPNGSYTVNLGFAELWGSHRSVNVLINGVLVLNHFDIFAKVGGNTADVESFPVIVTNGTIGIELDSFLGNGYFDNIDIEFVGTPPPPPPPINLTVHGTLLFDDTTPVASGIPILVQQLNTSGTYVNAGSVVSDSVGNLTGTITVDPNQANPAGFLTFQFGISGLPAGITQSYPVQQFQQGSTGVNLAVVLFKSAMLPKSFSAGLVP